MAFIIYGNIIEAESGKGIEGLSVKAFDKDLMFDDLLGAVKTNEFGYFKIIYDKKDYKELFLDAKPDIYLNVYDSGGNLILTTENMVRYRGNQTEEFIIEIPSNLIRLKPDKDLPERRQE